MDTEKFCLRWNDFERNISSAFKELRDDKDFFDVTLACEDEQIQAHKVIIAACSPFFRNILRRNQHQHPLLYMKGVKFTDLQAVLNFMYHGEVNVAQEELNSFLAVAEDLRVKGLTQTQTASHQPAPKQPTADTQRKSHLPLTKTAPKTVERKPPRPPAQSYAPHNKDDDEIEEVVSIKSEPRDLAPHAPPPVQPQVYSTAPQPVAQDTSVATYQAETGYEEYEDYQEDMYSEADNSMHNNMPMQGSDAAIGTVTGIFQDYIARSNDGSSWQCTLCGKECTQKVNLVKHVETVHFPDSFTHECKYCGETFNTKNKLYHHVRKHKN